MRLVPLCGRDGSLRALARIDEEDAERVLALRWCLHSGGYATRRAPGGGLILLHRFLAGLEAGDTREVDHINRVRLDCRRANLRVVTRAQNAQNVDAIGGASRFRGVSRTKEGDRWRARSYLNGHEVYIGTFSSELLAAEAAARFRAESMPFSEDARRAA